MVISRVAERQVFGGSFRRDSRLPFASSVDQIKLKTTNTAAHTPLRWARFAVVRSNWFATKAASAAPGSVALLDSRIDRVAGA